MRQLSAVSPDELDLQTTSLLPARETLCSIGCVNVANAVGVNVAVAVNAASINASADALAQQSLGVWQQ